MRRALRFPFPLATAALVTLSLLTYLGYSLSQGGLGFPLDDSWIHQTFARNLALWRQWAYLPGEPSAGSTSPLWTVLLTPGHLLPWDPKMWAYLWGAFFLGLTAYLVRRLYVILFADEGWAYLAGLFCLLEWHLVWAALSGMETLLFTTLSLLLLERHWRKANPFLLGLLGGLLTLTRPEGLLLFGLVALDSMRRSGPAYPMVFKSLMAQSVAFALLLAPYLIFHLLVAGHPLPNTFYAKHAEYLSSFNPLWLRFLRLPGVTLVGAQVLLLPGFLWALPRTIKERRVSLLLAWWAAFLAIYILYLPLTYQHGRYLIPIIPVFILLGLRGTANLLEALPSRLLKKVTALSGAILLAAFWLLGAQAYATDVRFIEEELVGVAHWLKENTPVEATIAAHDIGAIGYFSQRHLVDLAGLANPEVIPFINDEEKILAYLEERGVDYLVTFPSWYPRIVSSPKMRLIYRTRYPWSVTAGFENNAVYEATWSAR